MKKFSIFFILTIFTTIITVAAGISTISDRYSQYSTYANTDKMELLIPLLEGAIIRFSDFDKSKEIKCFEYIVPDTIWIKERPKKNPKEGKHYTLRYLYHSELASTNYTYIKNETYERTPATEFVGAQFRVDRVEPYKSSNYSSDNNYKIYLTDTATGEQLVWRYLKDSSSRNKCIVHLVSLSDSLGLAGQIIYSAKKVGYSDNKFSDVTRHKVLLADAQIDLTNLYPKFLIKFTTIDESNRIGTFILPLSSSSRYHSNDNIVWIDESQVEAVKESNRTYEIDHFVRLDTPDDSPLDFSYIYGVVDGYRGVYQTLKPESYQSSDDYISSGSIIFIGDRITVRGVDYYKAAIDGKPFFIQCSNVKLTPEDETKLNTLLESPREVRDAFFEYSKMFSYLSHLYTIRKALDELKSHAAKGISIPSWGPYDMSEYTDGTGIRFSFYNPTKKTIKYINITFVGYNAVDDRVGRPISKRCIGPIEPDETASYEFDYAWFTDVVEYAKITSLSVQYMDGTIKTIAKPTSVMWSDETDNTLNTTRLTSLKYEILNTEE